MAKEITICVKCKYFNSSASSDECTCEDAPLYDFVSGIKLCLQINKHGNCEWYEQTA